MRKKKTLFAAFFSIAIVSVILITKTILDNDSLDIRKEASSSNQNPGIDFEKTLFITPTSHHIKAENIFHYPNLPERLGAQFDSPYIKIGIFAPLSSSTETNGDLNDNGKIDSGEFVFDRDAKSRCSTIRGKKYCDNLKNYIDFSIEYNIPIAFQIGADGPWSSSGSFNDNSLASILEKEKSNLQWNQDNEVIPDTRNSPRNSIFSYNVFNTTVRRYVKRNVQQMASEVADFRTSHPDLFLAVTLDSDFVMQAWGSRDRMGYYDYNPNTIKQFRQWLSGSGVYEGSYQDSYNTVAIDYSAYKRSPSLSLGQVNNLAGRNWSSWNQVDPPRTLDQNDPWWQEWTKFRQSLIDAHIEEVATWIKDAGIEGDRIYPRQNIGYNRPLNNQDYIPGKSNNIHAVSIQSASIDSFDGGLGYNGSIGDFWWMQKTDHFKPTTFQQRLNLVNNNWSSFEAYNISPANKDNPLRSKNIVPFEDSWTNLVTAFNNNIHFLGIQAWNGPSCKQVPSVGGSAHAIRGCPLEDAIYSFVKRYGNIPRGDLYWDFGVGANDSKDNKDHTTNDRWNLYRHLEEVNSSNGLLKARTKKGTNYDPYMLGPNIFISPKKDDRLKIRIWTEKDDTMQFFFRNKKGWNYSGARSIKRGWNEVSFNLKEDLKWQSSKKILQLRFDPSTKSSNNRILLKIDWIHLSRSNKTKSSDPISKKSCKSADFWGNDKNSDGIVDAKDLSKLLSHWDKSNSIADFWSKEGEGSDGKVDAADLSKLLSCWGKKHN